MQTKKELIADNSKMRVALANLIMAVRESDNLYCHLCGGQREIGKLAEGHFGWGPIKHNADCALLAAYESFGDEVVDVEKVIL